MSPSAFIREAPFSKWPLTRNPTIGQCVENTTTLKHFFFLNWIRKEEKAETSFHCLNIFTRIPWLLFSLPFLSTFPAILTSFCSTYFDQSIRVLDENFFLAGFPDAKGVFSFHSLSWCSLSAAFAFLPLSVCFLSFLREVNSHLSECPEASIVLN